MFLSQITLSSRLLLGESALFIWLQSCSVVLALLIFANKLLIDFIPIYISGYIH